ncbi:MAG: tetratricopeptide repeat protein [Elusimicrobia bacterium]|nr:tetratricopeptide repeat protein [Elusimicrobiota bacterium]
MEPLKRILLVLVFFLCPLLFFTNLTRNPYVTQICLLNLALLGMAVLWLLPSVKTGEIRLPRTALDAPLLAWIGVCALSWLWAYGGHQPFFRPAMLNEGLLRGAFLLINCVIPFYLAVIIGCRAGQESEPILWPWLAFVICWGLAWAVFPQMRAPAAAAGDIPGLMWDGYGALVWGAGLAAAFWLCRRGEMSEYLHLAMAAAFLASVYGVLQYFNIELIWPYALNPYGGRSVSTFGNPNFMSSFNVVLLPLALWSFVRSEGTRRAAYGTLVLAIEAALLCSMTRSSWVGAAAGLGGLMLWPEFRRLLWKSPRPNGTLAITALLMFVLWPESSVASGYTPSTLGRLQELSYIFKPEMGYSPWYQRLLIWACAWLMGSENPLTGKGFGLFELFYPFYQGPLLDAYPIWRTMRTHANNSHNEILEVWAQTGILGTGVFIWLWTCFFRSLWSQSRATGAGHGSSWAAACGVFGMLVDNLLNVSLHFAVPAFIFWWFAGTACAGGSQERRWIAGKLALPTALLGLLLSAASSLFWFKTWNREVHYFAGFKLLRQNQIATAIRHLELSRSWGPPEVNALYELANAYARAERFPEADSGYHNALRANAGYDEIFYNIGIIKSAHLGQGERAIDYFRTAAALNPLAPEIYQSLAGLYFKDPKRYGGTALDLLARAIRIFPANPAHWNNLGYLHSLFLRYPEAEQAYARALSLDPGLELAERNLRAIWRQSGRPKPPVLLAVERLREVEASLQKADYSPAALAKADKVVEALGESSRARFYRGILLLARGRAEDARRDLEWVLQREPNHLSARINLGETLFALGRLPEASREFAAALWIDPNNARAAERLRAMGR